MRLLAALGLSGFVVLALACGGLPTSPPPRHDMPLRTYLAAAPREPVVMTLNCMLQPSPPDSETYQVWATDALASPSENAILGVRRDSPTGKAVFEILKDGSERQITLTVARPSGVTAEIVAVHP